MEQFSTVVNFIFEHERPPSFSRTIDRTEQRVTNAIRNLRRTASDEVKGLLDTWVPGWRKHDTLRATIHDEQGQLSTSFVGKKAEWSSSAWADAAKKKGEEDEDDDDDPEAHTGVKRKEEEEEQEEEAMVLVVEGYDDGGGKEGGGNNYYNEGLLLNLHPHGSVSKIKNAATSEKPMQGKQGQKQQQQNDKMPPPPSPKGARGKGKKRALSEGEELQEEVTEERAHTPAPPGSESGQAAQGTTAQPSVTTPPPSTPESIQQAKQGQQQQQQNDDMQQGAADTKPPAPEAVEDKDKEDNILICNGPDGRPTYKLTDFGHTSSHKALGRCPRALTGSIPVFHLCAPKRLWSQKEEQPSLASEVFMVAAFAAGRCCLDGRLFRGPPSIPGESREKRMRRISSFNT